jgi:hypothetical protein
MFNSIYDQNGGKLHHQDMLREADNSRLAHKVRANRSLVTRFNAPQRTPVRKLVQLVTALLR